MMGAPDDEARTGSGPQPEAHSLHGSGGKMLPGSLTGYHFLLSRPCLDYQR